MAVLSSSIGDNLGERFWFPFIETAKYFLCLAKANAKRDTA
jgi:hypothetical protein